MSEPEDCTCCGACCFSGGRGYLALFAVDLGRFEARDRADLVDEVDGRPCMRMIEGRCAALRVDPAESRFVCAIYGRRPDVCRSLVRGSGECFVHRSEKLERARKFCEALRELVGRVGRDPR
jgi:hypothetical protein